MGRCRWKDPVSENSGWSLANSHSMLISSGSLLSSLAGGRTATPPTILAPAVETIRPKRYGSRIVCGLTHGQLCLISPFWNGHRSIQESEKFLKRGEYYYVVGNSCSAVTALVGWVLWRLCHHQPNSPIAGSGRDSSCT